MKNLLKVSVIGSSKGRSACAALLLVAVFLLLPGGSAHAGVLDEMWSGLNVAVFGLIAFIFHHLIIAACLAFVRIGAYLVDVMLDPTLYQAAFDQSVVGPGLRTIRDFCDIFYIFFMLIIAFGTIIRSSTYNVRNLLPKVFISVLLIRFSDVIAKIVIDFGQVFLFGIAGWIGSFSGSTGAGAGLMSVVNNLATMTQGYGSGGDEIIAMIFCAMFILAVGFLYNILAVFLCFRIVMLVFLLVVSPFAFFGMVLPFTKNLTDQWKVLLIRNSISGPVLIFFIYISGVMMMSMASFSSAVTPQANVSSYLGGVMILIIKSMIPLAMLYMAIPATQKIGGYGASWTLNKMSWQNQGMALYAGGRLLHKGAKTADDIATSRSSRWAGVHDTMATTRQNLKDIKIKGHSINPWGMQMKQKDVLQHDALKLEMVQKRKDYYGKDWEKLPAAELAKSGNYYDKIIATEILAKYKQLGDVDDKTGKLKHEELFRQVEPYLDAKTKWDITDAVPYFATMTTENRGKNEEEKKGVLTTRLQGLVSDGKQHQVQGLAYQELASAWIDAQTNSQASDAVKKMTKAQRDKFVIGATAVAKDASDADSRAKYVSLAVRAGGKMTNMLQAQADELEVVGKVIASSNAADIAGWDKEDLKNYGHRIDKKRIADIAKSKEGVTRDRIEASIYERIKQLTDPSRKAPLTPEENTEMEELNDKMDFIRASLSSDKKETK